MKRIIFLFCIAKIGKKEKMKQLSDKNKYGFRRKNFPFNSHNVQNLRKKENNKKTEDRCLYLLNLITRSIWLICRSDKVQNKITFPKRRTEKYFHKLHGVLVHLLTLQHRRSLLLNKLS